MKRVLVEPLVKAAEVGWQACLKGRQALGQQTGHILALERRAQVLESGKRERMEVEIGREGEVEHHLSERNNYILI